MLAPAASAPLYDAFVTVRTLPDCANVPDQPVTAAALVSVSDVFQDVMADEPAFTVTDAWYPPGHVPVTARVAVQAPVDGVVGVVGLDVGLLDDELVGLGDAVGDGFVVGSGFTPPNVTLSVPSALNDQASAPVYALHAEALLPDHHELLPLSVPTMRSLAPLLQDTLPLNTDVPASKLKFRSAFPTLTLFEIVIEPGLLLYVNPWWPLSIA